MTSRYDDADELELALSRATRLAEKAPANSREAQEAEAVRANLAQRLAAAQHRDAKRAAAAKMTPAEIVDESMRR